MSVMLCVVVRRHYLYVRQVGHMPHTERVVCTNRKTLFGIVSAVFMARRLLLFVVRCYSRLLGQICTCRAHCDDFSLLWSFRFSVFFFSFSIQCTTQNDDNSIGLCAPFPFVCTYFFCFFFRFASTVSIAATLFHPTTYTLCNNVKRTRARATLFPREREKWEKKKKLLMFSSVSILTSNENRHRKDFVLQFKLAAFPSERKGRSLTIS